MCFFTLASGGSLFAESMVEKHRDSWPSTLDHYTLEGYKNPPPATGDTPKGLAFYMRRIAQSIFPPEVPSEHLRPESEVIEAITQTKETDSLTWLGHSCFLISIGGKLIMTDPFLTERASPLSWAGPKRLTPSPVELDKLPQVDGLVVSHNHYDHLDADTVESLKNKEEIEVFVPLGLKSFFLQRGYRKVHEFDWGDDIYWSGIHIKSLPAIHNSGRSAGTVDKTLWTAWSITSQKLKLYFAGDTAYSDTLFKQTGIHEGPFDYALIPIGAYSPRAIMRHSHLNPEEAFALGLDIQANTLVAMHWGTIMLSDEPFMEPPIRFKKMAELYSKDATTWIMDIGETRSLSETYSPVITTSAVTSTGINN